MATKVAVLGTTGMLGSMIWRWLRQQSDQYDLVSLDRADVGDLSCQTAAELASRLTGCQYAINCIGIVKPRIDDTDPQSVQQAIRVNSLLPYVLAEAADMAGCTVLQIATDCVYSGRDGNYCETSPHDATDIYGRTKSLGEVCSPLVHLLRCSIIGPEPVRHYSLMDWLLGQERGAKVRGFVSHRWNGVTTLAFAKLVDGVMRNGVDLPSLQHVVPADTCSKSNLLRMLAHAFSRRDIVIEEVRATLASGIVDRTLATADPERNRDLWRAAGYSEPPTIARMIAEMAGYLQAGLETADKADVTDTADTAEAAATEEPK